jgi:hypothetical protein
MLSGLEKVKSHRMWFVPGFVVWGLPGLEDAEYLVFEETPSASSLFFAETEIGDMGQLVAYSQLTDHRGNSLPGTISAPKVFPRARGTEPVFIVGEENTESFRIGRDSETSGPVTVDLLIIEMGE